MRTFKVFSAGAVALAAVASTGCYTMRMVPVSYVNIKQPPTVFVRDVDGGFYQIGGPSVSSDSLRGNDLVAGEPVSVSIRDVDAMAVRQLSVGKTSGLVAFGTVFLGAVTYGLINAGSGDDCKRVARDPGQCGDSAPPKYSQLSGQ